MQQITHKLPTGTLMFQEVRNSITSNILVTSTNKLLTFDQRSTCFTINIPQGNWQLLGSSTDITEEQLKEIMPTLWNGFVNFLEKDKPVGNYKRYVVKTALESYNSLKICLGIVDECNCSDEDSHNCYKCLKLKSYQVLFKKN